jgi:hypothetical protein
MGKVACMRAQRAPALAAVARRRKMKGCMVGGVGVAGVELLLYAQILYVGFLVLVGSSYSSRRKKQRQRGRRTGAGGELEDLRAKRFTAIKNLPH